MIAAPTNVRSNRRFERGWTFVEMLVAISLSAIFMGAAALVYHSAAANSKRLSNLIEIDIGQANNQNFYNQSGNIIRVYSAPNYGKAAIAQELRDRLIEDTQIASSVFALPRRLRNTIRPEFLRFEAGEDTATVTRPLLDSPEAFRQYLASVEPSSSGIYDTVIRNVPPVDRPNASIYVLGPEDNPGFIRVLAIYEIDFVTPTNQSGSYATVRRYQNGALTDYYDVFYPSGDGDEFYPAFAVFERAGRLTTAEGTATDRFKVAPGSPFQFVWLPDPAINPLKKTTTPSSDPATSPRQAYANQSGKTTYLVALPVFPNL